VKKILDYDWSVSYDLQLITAVLRYSLPVLKIYSTRYMHYRFSVLAVNIGTQPQKHNCSLSSCIWLFYILRSNGIRQSDTRAYGAQW